MEIYYITEKSSQTGLKMQKLMFKLKSCRKAAKDFAEKYGFEEYTHSCVRIGGIYQCCSFNKTPDPKIWKKSSRKGCYKPRKNTKAGQKVLDEMERLPSISTRILNEIIGYMDGFPNNSIGYDTNSENYFGFILKIGWKIVKPEDCVEVTATEYFNLFNNQR